MAIDLIADNGTAQESHVQADLMCPPGKWMDLEQGVLGEALQGQIFRRRLAPLFIWHNGQAVGLDSLVKLPEGIKLGASLLWINQAGIIRVDGRAGVGQPWSIFLLYPAGQ